MLISANCGIFQVLLPLSLSNSVLLSEWPLQHVPGKTHTGVRSSTDTISGHQLMWHLKHRMPPHSKLETCSNFQATSGVNQGLACGGLRSCELCVTPTPLGPGNVFTMAEDSLLHEREMQSTGWTLQCCASRTGYCLPYCTHNIILSLPWFPLRWSHSTGWPLLFKLMLKNLQELFSLFQTLWEFWHCLCWEHEMKSLLKYKVFKNSIVCCL